MDQFEALKNENDFGPATYWNRPVGTTRKHRSKYANLKTLKANRQNKPTPPQTRSGPALSPSISRAASPTPSQQSKHLSLTHSAKRTSTADEMDAKDDKAIQKIMKSKLPTFSDEKDWEAAIFEIKLILARVWPHKEDMDITDYMTNSTYRRTHTEDLETRADHLIYYALTMSAKKDSYAKLQILSASHRNAIPCVMVNEGKKLFLLFEGQFEWNFTPLFKAKKKLY